MGRNPISGHRRQTISVHEVWLEELAGMVRYEIRTNYDGGASKIKMEGPITKKEYFKRKLGGDV